jgi:hypothetical protein
MQVHGAAQRGAGTTKPRPGGRLVGVLAIASIVVVVAVMALLVWAGPLATSGVGTQDATPPKAGAAAGAAVVHDDAGNMPDTGAGAAVVHDDAGNVR